MRRQWAAAVALVLASAVVVAGCGGVMNRRASGSSGTPSSTSSTTASPTTSASTTTSVASPWNLTLSSTTLVADGTVTLMGTGCVQATATSAELGPEDLTPVGPLETSPNGDWSQTFSIPELVVGPSRVYAGCTEHDPLTMGVGYPTLDVTVTTPFRIDVEPSGTVMPGTSLTVSSTAGCPDDYPAVDLENPANGIGFAPSPSTAVFVPQRAGESWTTTLPIPPGTAPGQYMVVGRCYDATYVLREGGTTRTYEPVPITIG